MEKKKEKENNGENSGPLASLPVDRMTATDCNAAARANIHICIHRPIGAQFMYYVIHINIQLRSSLLLLFVLMVLLMLFLAYLYLGQFISELQLVA